MARCLSICALAMVPSLSLADALSQTQGAVEGLAQGVENGTLTEAAEAQAVQYGMDKANTAADTLAADILKDTDFVHLELSFGTDAFGLDGGGTEKKSELMAVYRLYENDNWFVFNQTSAINFDGRTTANVGFGTRYINDAETVIAGANVFYDYEFESEHSRWGTGVELVSSAFEARANMYRAISGTINYDSIDETALDGYDFKLTANLPYLYSSNIYYKTSNFSDDNDYSIDQTEWGAEAEVYPNLFVTVAHQNPNNTKSQTVASISYSVPLGSADNGPSRQMQDGSWSSKLEPIRDQLYEPVERENRIMKKSMKIGVTVSGI